MAGRAPPHDVRDRAEAGPLRSRRDRGVRRARRQRAPPDRALPADRRRHPRHQPQGVERLEGASCSRTCSARRAACCAGDSVGVRPATCRRSRARRSACCASTRCPRRRRGRLWTQLDTPYFQRHEPQEIAWHTRTLYYRVDTDRPGGEGAAVADGEGLQVLIYVPDQKELFARICGFFERISFDPRGEDPHDAPRLRARHLPGAGHRQRRTHYRDMIELIEHELAERLERRGAARAAGARPRVAPAASTSRSRRKCTSGPTRRGTYHVVSVTRGRPARPALGIARVLSRLRHQPAHREDQHARRARRGRVPGVRAKRWRSRRRCCSSSRSCWPRCSDPARNCRRGRQ